MGYKSIDALQNDLANEVFHYTKDRKKAAGRALGTLVEVVTHYLLCAWGLRNNMVIERKLPEYANPDIAHNVEFSLHPVLARHELRLASSLPVTPAKVRRAMPALRPYRLKSNQIVTRQGVKRNATVLTESERGPIVAHVDAIADVHCELTVSELRAAPFAIYECKRVGVEEGLRKGPQTIEKAKQGAYVARAVSSLQKLRGRSGEIYGIIEDADGAFRLEPYDDLLREVIGASALSQFPGFILTVGVVSNHGNWFAADNINKELLVLAQSYDWLLFLTDAGLQRFIEDLLLDPDPECVPARRAFLASYSGGSGKNRFTKVNMDLDADDALTQYFRKRKRESESWFNVISPRGATLEDLKSDLNALAAMPS